MRARPVLGVSAILFAIGFNVPYAVLAVTFDYPGILREPAGDVLERFTAGGAPLVLTCYAFMWAALLFVPLAAALALTRERITASPGLAIGAAIAGSLSGALQAIGLARWVFVIPAQATAPAAGQPSAAVVLEALKATGRVARWGQPPGEAHDGVTRLLLARHQRSQQLRRVVQVEVGVLGRGRFSAGWGRVHVA